MPDSQHDHDPYVVRPGCVQCYADLELDTLHAFTRGRMVGRRERRPPWLLAFALAVALLAGAYLLLYVTVGPLDVTFGPDDVAPAPTGITTATAAPSLATVVPTPAVAPAGPDRNCTDFVTWADAQTFYEAAGGPAADPHRLDRDRDGVACQSLPGAP